MLNFLEKQKFMNVVYTEQSAVGSCSELEKEEGEQTF
jgi:hypothetical protein